MSCEGVVREYKQVLEVAFPILENPSECEKCGKQLADHEWVDLNPDGFVVECSFNAKVN